MLLWSIGHGQNARRSAQDAFVAYYKGFQTQLLSHYRLSHYRTMHYRTIALPHYRTIALPHYRTIALSTHNAIIPTPIVSNAFFVRHATTIAISPASKRTLVSDTSI